MTDCTVTQLYFFPNIPCQIIESSTPEAPGPSVNELRSCISALEKSQTRVESDKDNISNPAHILAEYARVLHSCLKESSKPRLQQAKASSLWPNTVGTRTSTQTEFHLLYDESITSVLLFYYNGVIKQNYTETLCSNPLHVFYSSWRSHVAQNSCTSSCTSIAPTITRHLNIAIKKHLNFKKTLKYIFTPS